MNHKPFTKKTQTPKKKKKKNSIKGNWITQLENSAEEWCLMITNIST